MLYILILMFQTIQNVLSCYWSETFGGKILLCVIVCVKFMFMERTFFKFQ